MVSSEKNKDKKNLFEMALDSHMKGDLKTAILLYERDIQETPQNDASYINLGVIAAGQNCYDDAVSLLEHALSINPLNPDAWANLSSCYRRVGKLNDSLVAADKSLDLDENHLFGRLNIALTYAALGEYKHAVQWSKYTLDIDKDNLDAIYNLGFCKLTTGTLNNKVWDDYEKRWQTMDYIDNRHTHIPRLMSTKDKIEGKNLLLWMDNDKGHCLQLLRFTHRLKETLGNPKISIECPNNMISLLESMDGDIEFIPEAQAQDNNDDPINNGNFDFQLPISSLPALLNLTMDDIKQSESSNIFSVTGDVEIPSVFSQENPKLKVGLIWKNIFPNSAVNYKELVFSDLQSMFKLKGKDFFSLQKGDVSKDLLRPDFKHEVINLAPWLMHLKQIAAFMQNMDLVVTIDNEYAHLAASLGVKCWVFVPKNHGWYWFEKQGAKPWYNNVVLYHQKEVGAWEEPIKKMIDDLDKLQKK